MTFWWRDSHNLLLYILVGGFNPSEPNIWKNTPNVPIYITIDTIYCSMIFCYVLVLLTAAPHNFHWDPKPRWKHIPCAFLLNALSTIILSVKYIMILILHMYIYIYMLIPMTDPWCWYINANMDGVFVDGIHGTPYKAAPRWIPWDITCQSIADFIQATHVDGSIDRPSDPPSPWKLLYLRNQQKLCSFLGWQIGIFVHVHLLVCQKYTCIICIVYIWFVYFK